MPITTLPVSAAVCDVPNHKKLGSAFYRMEVPEKLLTW
jgi:hypothetical protein